MAAIVLLVVVYFLYATGTLAKFGIGNAPVTSSLGVPGLDPTATQVTAAAAQANANAAAQTAQTAKLVQSSATGLTSSLQAVQSSTGALGGAAAAIPVVGAAVSVIASVLIAASQKRAKEATSENTAVNNGYPGWDAAVQQIVGAFNGGQIDAVGAQTLLAQALTNYWNEVTPQIQPGRNGCNGGASCPPSSNPSSDSAYTTTANASYCSGSIGAACCVGCADLALSNSNLQYAAALAEKTGQPQTAFVQAIAPSKYGTIARPSYTVTFTPVVA